MWGGSMPVTTFVRCVNTGPAAGRSSGHNQVGTCGGRAGWRRWARRSPRKWVSMMSWVMALSNQAIRSGTVGGMSCSRTWSVGMQLTVRNVGRVHKLQMFYVRC